MSTKKHILLNLLRLLVFIKTEVVNNLSAYQSILHLGLLGLLRMCYPKLVQLQEVQEKYKNKLKWYLEFF